MITKKLIRQGRQIDVEKLKQFYVLYVKHKGSAWAAMRELHPYLTPGSAAVHAHRYLNYIDPYKIVFKRLNNPEPLPVIKEPKPPKPVKLTKREENQRIFDGLYEKHGANGLRSAVLAIKEMSPGIANREGLKQKARKYLVRSQVIVNMVAALESKGTDAFTVAERITDLLNAKKRIRTRINDGDYQEIEELDSSAIDKGISHALKAGVGGGYAPDRSLVGVGEFSLSGILKKLKDKKESESRESESQESQSKELESNGA